MIREFSAGGVVLRHMRNRWWLAAIQPQGREEPIRALSAEGGTTKRSKPKSLRDNELWALPKGLIDPGEHAEQAALREVHEETGLLVTPLGRLGDVRYFYVRSWGDRQRVFKVVTFFLFLYRSGRLGEIREEMRKEIKQARWIPLDQAPTLLAYKGEREMAERAQAYLLAHPELQNN